MKINYLNVPQVLAIHDQAVRRFGGSFGVRDIGLVESAIARPRATYDGNDLYRDIFDKTAALLQSPLKNHPFIDGNKRTALSSAGIFLKMNGYSLQNKHEEEVKFAIKVDNEHLSLEQISSWLKKNSKKN
ncbi:MAG: death-on-curing family protein [Microgenomates group bacterium Gr01-1014_5]|nr:MAG: death-on-curing family protein [Microgenomates group bacterium Gr01-1014_5]